MKSYRENGVEIYQIKVYLVSGILHSPFTKVTSISGTSSAFLVQTFFEVYLVCRLAVSLLIDGALQKKSK